MWDLAGVVCFCWVRNTCTATAFAYFKFVIKWGKIGYNVFEYIKRVAAN